MAICGPLCFPKNGWNLNNDQPPLFVLHRIQNYRKVRCRNSSTRCWTWFHESLLLALLDARPRDVPAGLHAPLLAFGGVLLQTSEHLAELIVADTVLLARRHVGHQLLHAMVVLGSELPFSLRLLLLLVRQSPADEHPGVRG